MAVTKTVNVETTNAHASTTLTDTTPTVPLADTPQGLMVIGPQVTLHFVEGAWNKANTYDYYDVVQVDGTSYIAVQDVPANTAITNTAYWAKWNDPNEQVKLVQDTVSEFDGRITTAQSTADSAKTTAASAKTTADAAKTAAGTAQSTATAAQTTANKALSAATKFDIVCMGDSLASGIINDGSSPDSQYGWLRYVKDHKPANVDTVYDNTSTVIAGNTGFTSTRKFLAVITDMVTNVITNKDTVKHVYVSGGTNDGSAAATTITSAITEFCNYVKARLPNADITICFQATGSIKAREAYRDGANTNGCKFVDLWPLMSLPAYLSDGTHLTNEGYRLTIPYVYNALFNGIVSGGSLYEGVVFNAGDLANGYKFGGTDSGIQEWVKPGTYALLARSTKTPTLVSFTKDSYANAGSGQVLLNNFKKYIPAGAVDVFFPAFVQGNNEQGFFMLYYDSSDNTLKIPATNFSSTVGHKITITMIPSMQNFIK